MSLVRGGMDPSAAKATTAALDEWVKNGGTIKIATNLSAPLPLLKRAYNPIIPVASALASNTSDERTAELPRWLHRYNWHRPRGSIGSLPPVSRLRLTGNDLLKLHS